MESAILDLIETELICLKDERARLKDKKTNLERIRAALKSQGMAGATVIQSVVKKDKVKKGKDPNKPKRPQSAYNLFYQDKAQIYKEQNPHVPQKDIMSIIGPTWKDCVGEEKAAYERKALALKQEFELKLAQYNAGLAGGNTPSVPASGGSVGHYLHNREDEDEDSDDEGSAKKKAKLG
jgi:hypothetical protein